MARNYDSYKFFMTKGHLDFEYEARHEDQISMFRRPDLTDKCLNRQLYREIAVVQKRTDRIDDYTEMLETQMEALGGNMEALARKLDGKIDALDAKIEALARKLAGEIEAAEKIEARVAKPEAAEEELLGGAFGQHRMQQRGGEY